MKAETLELPLFVQRQKQVKGFELLLMKQALDCRGWVLIRDLQKTLKWPRRKFQAIANASKGTIVSGQKGYALLSALAWNEAAHAAAWLDHQAEAMKRRAAEIRLELNKRTGEFRG